MTVVENPERPSPYFGDYPHGAYWSAVRPPDDGTPEEEDYGPFAEGSELRIMWDEGAGPLWGDEGLLPDESEWFRRALGLSESLIADLLHWMSDMDTFHYQSIFVADEWRGRQQQLWERGTELAGRLHVEVGSRYRVRFHG